VGKELGSLFSRSLQASMCNETEILEVSVYSSAMRSWAHPEVGAWDRAGAPASEGNHIEAPYCHLKL
jgi:hypothetical protein